MGLTIFLYSSCFLVRKLALLNATRELKNPFFELDFYRNTGAAFSTFENSGYVLAVLALMVVFFIVVYICYNTWRISYLKLVLFSTLTAGIAANLFERISQGYVTDYIKIKLFNFPVFNFQDVLIVLSCIFLFIMFQFENHKISKEEASLTSFSDESENIEND